MAVSRTTGRSGGGRVSKIQEVLDQIGQLDDDSATHRQQAQAIVKELKEKHRKSILRPAFDRSSV